MEKLGIYMTDASFDKKSKVSSISFIEKNTSHTKNIQRSDIPNIFEAEYEGIRQCLIHAYKKFANVIVICDNKAAIFKAQRELKKSMKLKERFSSYQFLWLPREYMEEADFLTKNVDKDLNKKLKIDNSTHGNVFDIFVSKEDFEDILKKHIDLFKLKYDIDIDRLKILDRVLEGELIDPINEIENISHDIKYIIEKYPQLGQKNSDLQKIIEVLYLV